MKYTIMQIKDIENCAYIFMRYEFAKKHNFKLNDYAEVYSSDMPREKNESLEHFLDSVFTIFNIHRPENFNGHSMSVSDLVKLEDGRVFYCDSCGWTEVK